MLSSSATRLRRIFVNLVFFYVALATLANGLIVRRVSRNWIISDWLINYEGGFVRRGLPGEVAYLLGRLLHLSPVLFVVVFYLSLYAILFLAVRSLALSSSMNLWVLALIASPATLSFQILHPLAGFRKELIFLAALALFVVLLRRTSISPVAATGYITLVTVVAVFSHEGLIFFAPYFFAALVLGGRTPSQALRQCIVPAIAGAAVFYLCTSHLGNVEIAARICSSLGYKLMSPVNSQICGSGAIPYLRQTRAMAQVEAFAIIRDQHYLTIFPGFVLLTLLPAVAESIVLGRRGLRLDLRVLWISSAVAFLGSIVLFVYGVDWGRWIYIHITSLTILLISLDAKTLDRATALPAEEPMSTPVRRAAGMAFLFAYALLWILPNGAGEQLHMGYVGRLLYLHHYNSHAASSEPVTSE